VRDIRQLHAGQDCVEGAVEVAERLVLAVDGPALASPSQFNHVLSVRLALLLADQRLLYLYLQLLVTRLRLALGVFEGVRANEADVEMGDEDTWDEELGAVLALKAG
jgi:hypothetical protein